MRSICLLSLLFSFLILTMLGCSSSDDNGTDSAPVVYRVVIGDHQDPGTGSVNSVVWDSITGVIIPIGTRNAYNANVGFTTSLNLEIKGLIADDTVLYLRCRWNDDSKNNKFGELRARLINQIYQWEQIDTTDVRNEDRIYILFDKSGTNGADCATFCHTDTSSAGRIFYGNTGDAADIWHWKAHRTGLANLAEDQRLTTTMVESDARDQLIDQLYFPNYDDLLPKPEFMHVDTTAYTGVSLLESDGFIAYNDDLQWVEISGSDTTGLYMPGYFIYDLSGTNGSRWDVAAISEHDGTHWTVVFRRSLTTADIADIDFDFAARDSVEISIALCNNNGIEHHGVAPFYLIFE